MKNVSFEEEQRFSQWWLWLLLAFVVVRVCFGLYQQIFLGKQFGSNPISDMGLIVSILIIFSVMLMFAVIKIKTIVDAEGIRMNFYPFKKKVVVWSEVQHACVIKYNFVGGWGIRLWTKYGTVYNIKGNRGLFVELKNGNKFLIGTQKEEELAKVIEFLQQQ